jgi:tetratricopeptide (TPR) repeat protein
LRSQLQFCTKIIGIFAVLAGPLVMLVENGRATPQYIPTPRGVGICDDPRTPHNSAAYLRYCGACYPNCGYNAPRPPTEAEIAARQALELNDQGIAAFKKGDWATAADLYEKSLAKRDDPVVRRNLANAQNHQGIDTYDKGDYTTALAYFQAALATDTTTDPDRHFIVEDIALAEGTIGEIRRKQEQRQREQELHQQDKNAANHIQHSVQTLAQSLDVAPSSGGLDFEDGKPSQKVGRGALGSKVAKPDSNDLKPTNPSSKPGTDTKAGDHLKTAAEVAASKGDLGKIYDEGGAKSSGSLVFPAAPAPPDFPRVPTQYLRDPQVAKFQDQWKAARAAQVKATEKLHAIQEARKKPGANKGALDVQATNTDNDLSAANSKLKAATLNIEGRVDTLKRSFHEDPVSPVQ